MNYKNFLIKNRKKVLYFLVVLLVIVFAFRIVQAKFSFSQKQDQYLEKVELVEVDNYKQEGGSVYSTGKVESLKQVNIKSELSAKVKKINFKIGDIVKEGQIILELDNATLGAQLSQAQASLDRVVAGASDEDIKIYQTLVELAKADLKKTKVDAEKLLSSYETALKVAKNNLNLGNDSLVGTLYSVNSSLSSALTSSDNILGIDNSLANDNFEDYLGVLDSSKLNKARSSYLVAKNSKKEFGDLMVNITEQSTGVEISDVAKKAQEALEKIKKHLFDVQEMLDATPPVGDLSQTSLNGLKNTVVASRTAINTVSSALTSVSQGEGADGSSLNSYNISYEKALSDLENAKKSSQSLIEIKEVSYKQALANLEKIKADPREVDLASLKAVISQSASVYNKSVIRAPFDGIISSMPFNVGDLVGPGQMITGVVNKEGMQVKAYINERERFLISAGNTVIVEDKYAGMVVNIAPSLNPVNKKIEVLIAVVDVDTNLTIGQYANVKISINSLEDSSEYVIPLSAVKIYPDYKVIFYLDDDIVKEKTVEVGNILGDNIEIKKGLNKEDKILKSVRGVNLGEKVIVK